MAWKNYLALGDSLSAGGRGDTDINGQRNGWTHRSAGILRPYWDAPAADDKRGR